MNKKELDILRVIKREKNVNQRRIAELTGFSLGTVNASIKNLIEEKLINEDMKLIKSRAGTDDSVNDDSDLGQLMRNLQTRMSDFKKLLDSFEDKLYKKYDAMEVALSRLGMQMSFLTGGQ